MGETLPFAIDTVRPSVIQIRVDSGRRDFSVVGTGFLVHPGGFALTAKHVTEAASRIQSVSLGSRLLAGLAMPNFNGHGLQMRANFELIECEIVEEDARHDLALLKLSRNPFESGKPSGIFHTPDGGVGVNAMFGLAPLTQEHPRDGAAIAVSGYPLSEPTLITTAGIIASAWGADVSEVRPPGAPDGFTIPDIKDSYIANVAVNPGNSGGPVYFVATGMVIGVCVAFRIAETSNQAGMPLRYNSGLSIVVPIKYGLDLLARNARI